MVQRYSLEWIRESISRLHRLAGSAGGGPEYLELFVTAKESVVVAHIVSGTGVNKPVPRTAVTPMAVGRERMRSRRLLVRYSPFCRGITPSGSGTCRPPVSTLLELHRTRHLFYMVFAHAVASQVQYCTSTQAQGEKMGGQSRHDDPRRCSRFYGHYGLWRRIRGSLCEAGLLAAEKALVAAKGPRLEPVCSDRMLRIEFSRTAKAGFPSSVRWRSCDFLWKSRVDKTLTRAVSRMPS